MKKIFEGTISCKSIIEENKRSIQMLYVDEKKNTKDFSYIVRNAHKNNIPVVKCNREKLDEISQSTKHGGMLLEALDRNIPSLAMYGKVKGMIAYIDGLVDPYNLGSICRTLYASGCNLLVLPRRDWSQAEKVILRASAGAYEKMDIAMIDDEMELIHYLKKHHIHLICAHRKDAISLKKYQFPSNCCIAVGGALRGLNSKITSNSDQNVYIEYGRDYRNALDTASAVAIFSFAYTYQEDTYENKPGRTR